MKILHPSPRLSRWRERARVAPLARIVAAGLLALVAAACAVSQPAPLRHSYLLHATRPEAAASAPGGPTLRIERVTVAAPFQGRPIVLRTGELAFEADFYNEFLVAPGPMIADRLVGWLAASGVFATVAPAGGATVTRYGLEMQVVELYGDLRDAKQPAAVLAARVQLLDASAAGMPVRLERLVQRRVAIPDRRAASVVAGLDRALSEVLTEIERELRAAAL